MARDLESRGVMETLVDATSSVKRIRISISRSSDLFNAASHKNFQVEEASGWSALGRIMTSKAWSPSIWKDGLRGKEHFQVAYLVGIDVDEGLSLNDAIEQCQKLDIGVIVGTTRNHQKIKDNKPACDRYRLVFKYDRAITDYREYEHNVRVAVDFWGGDAAAKDAARFFFPCKEIVHISRGADIYASEYDPTPAAAKIATNNIRKYLRIKYDRTPRWISAFLESGQLCRGKARNQTIFVVARSMTELGFIAEDIINAIKAAPIDRHDLTDRELDTAINSGINRGS